MELVQQPIGQIVKRDPETMRMLERKYDEAERQGMDAFHHFNDLEMVHWFLYAPKHLNHAHDRSARTIREYELELKQLITYLLQYGEEIGLDVTWEQQSLWKSLDKRHIRRYQQWLATDSPYVLQRGAYSSATLERKTSILSAFFRFLYESDYITRPIGDGLRIATVQKDERPNRDLGVHDVKRLLTHFKQQQHPIMFAIIQILTTTGLRNEEFCSLTVEQLKEDRIRGGHYLHVIGKGNKRRMIPLRPDTLRAIQLFRETRHASDEETAPLFTTSRGSAYTPSYFAQYVKKELSRVPDSYLPQDVIVTPHVFRHAFAIISKQNGADIYDIMRSLGHEKIETTMIYLEKLFEKERHTINQWDETFEF